MLHSIHITDFRQFKDCEVTFGKCITCIAGFNGTGKTTIMGLTGNSMMLSPKVMKTITSKQFKIEFRDLFKGSKKFDVSKSNICTVNFSDYSIPNKVVDNRVSRITWQENGKRFRVIPEWQFQDEKTGKLRKKSSKYPMPSYYLGLSRLYPVGETDDNELKFKNFIMTDNDKKWFVDAYSKILSMEEEPSDFEAISIPKASKKFSLGISTERYDYLTNSSGQDNLGQILLSVLSFEKCSNKLASEWKGGVLFIDEIDTTLHPSAQIKLCDFLYTEANKYKFQVVFTTHSFSLLEYITSKTEYNSAENLNNYQIVYLINANEKLQIISNPSIWTIRNDLFIKTLDRQRLDIICEDKANRRFFKALIKDYLEYVNIDENINVGCEELKHFYDFKPESFSSILFVVDGDTHVNSSLHNFIQNDNVLILPTSLPPDKLIYEYLTETNYENNFSYELGFTKRYIKEHGPSSYENKEHERQKYSSWFYDNQEHINKQKCFENWCAEHSEECTAFIKEFIYKYNKIAKKTNGRLIADI